MSYTADSNTVVEQQRLQILLEDATAELMALKDQVWQKEREVKDLQEKVEDCIMSDFRLMNFCTSFLANHIKSNSREDYIEFLKQLVESDYKVRIYEAVNGLYYQGVGFYRFLPFEPTQSMHILEEAGITITNLGTWGMK